MVFRHWTAFAVCMAAMACVMVEGAIVVSSDSDSAYCSLEERCMIDDDCSGSALCCFGQCKLFLNDTNPIGGYCGSTCNGKCWAGACQNGRCERDLGSLALNCTCEAAIDCNSGTCINSTCAATGLPAGASCVINGQCTGSLTCESGTCSALALGNTCVPGNGMCEADLRCISDASGGGSYSCDAPRDAGAYCADNADCATGLACNGRTNECIAFASLAAGTNCSQDVECVSHVCGPEGTCVDMVHSVPDGGLCPDGDINCRMGSACIGTDDDMGNRTCARTTGLLCSFSQNGHCGSNSECKCQGTALKCTPAAPQSLAYSNCLEERLKLSQVFAISVDSLPDLDLPMLEYPDNVQAIFAAAYCCVVCSEYDNYRMVTLGDNGQTEQPYKVVCSGTPHLEAVVDQDAKCSLTTPIPNQDVVQCGGQYPLLGAPTADDDDVVDEPWFIAVVSIGSILVCLVIAAVAFVVIRGASKGTKTASDPSSGQQMTAVSVNDAKGEDKDGSEDDGEESSQAGADADDDDEGDMQPEDIVDDDEYDD